MSAVETYEIYKESGSIGYLMTNCPAQILDTYICIHILEIHEYNLKPLVKHLNKLGWYAVERHIQYIDLSDDFYIENYIYALARKNQMKVMINERISRGITEPEEE